VHVAVRRTSGNDHRPSIDTGVLSAHAAVRRNPVPDRPRQDHSAAIDTPSCPPEPAMTTRRTPHAVALLLALLVTLATFSGVSALASSDQAGTMLVRAAAATSQA
jgi:hypothetical protein